MSSVLIMIRLLLSIAHSLHLCERRSTFTLLVQKHSFNSLAFGVPHILCNCFHRCLKYLIVEQLSQLGEMISFLRTEQKSQMI